MRLDPRFDGTGSEAPYNRLGGCFGRFVQA
jgi:hypothetical protein